MYGLLNVAIIVVSFILICCAWLVLKFLQAWEDGDSAGTEQEDVLGVMAEMRNRNDL